MIVDRYVIMMLKLYLKKKYALRLTSLEICNAWSSQLYCTVALYCTTCTATYGTVNLRIP